MKIEEVAPAKPSYVLTLTHDELVDLATTIWNGGNETPADGLWSQLPDNIQDAGLWSQLPDNIQDAAGWGR
jgi:hypothetical protein